MKDASRTSKRASPEIWPRLAQCLQCKGKVFQSDIDKLDNFDSKLMDARTVAVVSLVWSENIRSYTSRSFDKPVWHDVLGNKHMQKAILFSVIVIINAVSPLGRSTRPGTPWRHCPR